MRIKVTLFEGWIDCSRDNPNGPPTYLRELSSVPGPFQISWADYTGGKVPNPTMADLEKFSCDAGKEQGWGEVVESSSGNCTFGIFGTTVFRSPELSRSQIWWLSNGKDFIFATHICPEQPDPVEVQEVQEIVRMLTVGENKPWWKFW
jgi:hypothetical protein